MIEPGDAGRDADHADGLIHDDDAARAGHRVEGLLFERVEVVLHVELVGPEHGAGGAAGDDRTDGTAVERAAAVEVAEDDVAERDAVGDLVGSGPLHLARDLHNLGAAVLLRPLRSPPLRATLDDERYAGDALHVVHHGGASEDADHSGERGLEAGLAGLALERLDERRLFAADVGARTAMHIDVEVEAAPLDVLAEQAGRVELGDGRLHALRRKHQLAAHVDVGCLEAERVAGDDAALHEAMGVALHDEAVLEGARLALVGIHHEVLGHIGPLGQEGPLRTHGEAGAAATAEVRLDELRHHGAALHPEDLLQALESTMLLVDRQRVGLLHMPVGGDDAFHDDIGAWRVQRRVASSASMRSGVRFSWNSPFTCSSGA